MARSTRRQSWLSSVRANLPAAAFRQSSVMLVLTRVNVAPARVTFLVKASGTVSLPGSVFSESSIVVLIGSGSRAGSSAGSMISGAGIGADALVESSALIDW